MSVVKSVIAYSDAVFSCKTFCRYTTFIFLPENTANGCCLLVCKPQRGGGFGYTSWFMDFCFRNFKTSSKQTCFHNLLLYTGFIHC